MNAQCSSCERFITDERPTQQEIPAITNKASFSDKVAFVTGAGAGIGKATAIAFAQEGARVAVVGIAEPGLRETVRHIEAAGRRAMAIRCDVSDEDGIRRAVEAFGGIDFAFNNAGIEQPPATAADIASNEFDRLIAVNLRGVFLSMKYQIPQLIKRGGGAIVNTSSGAGVKGFRNQAAYAASKHGMIGLSKSAAAGLGV
ncbi:SDR family NAD(P)-dependent oxidoreductase [Frateuria aurantia]|uniref:SDR family NAD(P)-dependent oxidoreductase n=1 Tax=Frateuria aurantia TaxID=81475 RepID=UPI001C25B085|nr:SDR family NAD(P)-dependent oxidoreductase [Frateuria aurantia]